MSVREGLEFETQIASDTAPLNNLVETILDATPDIHVFRDPTRGGITSALTEIAQTARVGIMLDEALIPISEEVKGACEILGLDLSTLLTKGSCWPLFLLGRRIGYWQLYGAIPSVKKLQSLERLHRIIQALF